MDIDALLLTATSNGGVIEDTYPWSQSQGVDHALVVGGMNSLMGDGYLVSTAKSVEFWVLTEEAEGYVSRGSPEKVVFTSVPAEGEGLDEGGLTALLGEALVKVGLGKCLKNKWVARDKATGRYTRIVASVERDELVEQLLSIKGGAVDDAALIKDLKKRQLISLV